MTNLTLAALQNHESPVGVYNIVEDYTILGGTFTMPADKTLKFNGGTINNGTLELNNTLLQDMVDGCINARITGTVQNTILYTKKISGINNLGLSNYSGMTIYCDQNETNVSTGIVINGANATSNTTETVFDGLNNSFFCSTTFFTIGEGSKKVTIQNFNATALSNAGNIDFEKMNSSPNISNITVQGNHITGFAVGISINGDLQNCEVYSCTVKNNEIYNAKGINSGQGYGIHLANARNCEVSNNLIVNSGRHSIYHAYGCGNQILNNSILNHKMTELETVPRSAIEVLRKSTNLTIRGNYIYNSYNVGILLFAFPHSYDDSSDTDFNGKYGCIDCITIDNNTFVTSGISGNLGGLPSIMLGYLYNGDNTPHTSFNTYYVNRVTISNNHFVKVNTEAFGCIRIDQCRIPTISGNTFTFVTPSTGHETDLIEIRSAFKNDESMEAEIKNNAFNAQNPITNYSIFCVGNLLNINNSLFNVTVENNTLSNTYSPTPGFYIYQPVGITSIAGSNLTLQSE